jgi:hypothetical protein
MPRAEPASPPLWRIRGADVVFFMLLAGRLDVPNFWGGALGTVIVLYAGLEAIRGLRWEAWG